MFSISNTRDSEPRVISSKNTDHTRTDSVTFPFEGPCAAAVDTGEGEPAKGGPLLRLKGGLYRRRGCTSPCARGSGRGRWERPPKEGTGVVAPGVAPLVVTPGSWDTARRREPGENQHAPHHPCKSKQMGPEGLRTEDSCGPEGTPRTIVTRAYLANKKESDPSAVLLKPNPKNPCDQTSQPPGSVQGTTPQSAVAGSPDRITYPCESCVEFGSMDSMAISYSDEVPGTGPFLRTPGRGKEGPGQNLPPKDSWVPHKKKFKKSARAAQIQHLFICHLTFL